jgi:hypothetical protein
MIKIDFLEFVNYQDTVASTEYGDIDVVNMYLYRRLPVREIAKTTGKSIGEIYRSLRRQYNEPNRRRTDQFNVFALADSGMPVRTIADLTGYTSRQVRNILKKS